MKRIDTYIRDAAGDIYASLPDTPEVAALIHIAAISRGNVLTGSDIPADADSAEGGKQEIDDMDTIKLILGFSWTS